MLQHGMKMMLPQHAHCTHCIVLPGVHNMLYPTPPTTTTTMATHDHHPHTPPAGIPAFTTTKPPPPPGAVAKSPQPLTLV
jgi:hypothetical protein